jgi:hypothetical protein
MQVNLQTQLLLYVTPVLCQLPGHCPPGGVRVAFVEDSTDCSFPSSNTSVLVPEETMSSAETLGAPQASLVFWKDS